MEGGGKRERMEAWVSSGLTALTYGRGGTGGVWDTEEHGMARRSTAGKEGFRRGTGGGPCADASGSENAGGREPRKTRKARTGRKRIEG